MSRAALKSALLGLKKSMRNMRASKYAKKEESDGLPKGNSKASEEAPGDSDNAELEVDKGSMESSDKASSKEEAGVDFADEIKQFMSRQNKGKPKQKTALVSFGSEAMKSSAMPQAPKKKGK